MVWDGTDENNLLVPAGIYFSRVKIANPSIGFLIKSERQGREL
jgi:hypothetical protein